MHYNNGFGAWRDQFIHVCRINGGLDKTNNISKDGSSPRGDRHISSRNEVQRRLDDFISRADIARLRTRDAVRQWRWTLPTHTWLSAQWRIHFRNSQPPAPSKAICCAERGQRLPFPPHHSPDRSVEFSSSAIKSSRLFLRETLAVSLRTVAGPWRNRPAARCRARDPRKAMRRPFLLREQASVRDPENRDIYPVR